MTPIQNLSRIIIAVVLAALLHTTATAETQPWQPPTVRILFAGNSLTRHRPLRMHQGNWGMAASSESNDYVHQTVRLYSEHAGVQVDYRLAHLDIPWTDEIPAYEQAIVDFAPDVVVLQVGDNAKQDEEEYKVILRRIIEATGNRRVVLTGAWYGGHREAWNAAVAAEYANVLFVPINDIRSDATVADAACHDDPICSHPGDAGMLAIAERLQDALPDFWLYFPQVGG